MTQYDGVVANSVNDLDVFRRITDKRLVMIENGVNTAKFAGFGSKTFKPSFVCIGRFAANKGLNKMVDTFDLIVRNLPQAQLHIVGNDFDGLYARLQQRISALPNGDRISVHMGLSDDAMRDVLSECSFFVSASEYEGFGQTVVEAMSAGLLPIVNRIPSFDRIVGTTSVGRLTDFSSPETAAQDTLTFVRQTEQRYNEYRAEAIKASHRYSWDGTAKRFTEVYEQVTDTGNAGPFSTTDYCAYR